MTFVPNLYCSFYCDIIVVPGSCQSSLHHVSWGFFGPPPLLLLPYISSDVQRADTVEPELQAHQPSAASEDEIRLHGKVDSTSSPLFGSLWDVVKPCKSLKGGSPIF